MVGFIILLLVMIGIWGFFLTSFDISEVTNNWEKYRCSPFIIPFSSFFGHDTQENFRFCVDSIFSGVAGPLLGPFTMILGSFITILSGLVTSINSVRLEFATMMGGINLMFQNFADRMNQLGVQLRMTTTRMRFLMRRIFATMYAMVYMAMSATTGLMNFSNTILFRFLDTFCFDPSTLVQVKDKGFLPISLVKIGDILERTQSRVTSTFSFLADGQPMVELPGRIFVSTNHYVQMENGQWVRADQHPDALPSIPWMGGTERPLICLNTENHLLPVGNYIFLDYDETEEADQKTMKWVYKQLNGVSPRDFHTVSYTTVFSPNTQIFVGDNKYMAASEIKLGQMIPGGQILSVIRKEIREVCRLPTGEYVTPGQLIWVSEKGSWIRAGDIYSCEYLSNCEEYVNFIVSPAATIETKCGSVFRDYFEVHSPDTEQFFSHVIESR
jgi:hypothetical protein